MLSSDPLPRYSLKSVKSQGKSYYVDDRGNRFPSVTTILNATRPPEARERLANWQQRVGVEEAARITSTASRRGTGTHQYIQRYLKGEFRECPDHLQAYWQSIEPVLQSVERVRLLEGAVFHGELGYAGKVDCVASYDGVPCLCEWKTADRPKQTLERLYDYPLQVVAYWGALNQLYQNENLNLTHALLAIAIPHQPAEIFWFEPETLADYWQQWEERVAIFWRRLGYFRS